MPDQAISDWEIFKLLMWKNWSVTSSTPWVHVLSLLSPVLFSLILVILRLKTPVVVIETMEYKPIEMELRWQNLIDELRKRYETLKNVDGFAYNIYVPRLVIAYAPSIFDAYHNIMNMTVQRLKHVELKVFQDCNSLRHTMEGEAYLAGVCFNETMPLIETETIRKVGIYPNRLDYTLVFPSELRMYGDMFISANWQTNTLYNHVDQSQNRFERDNDGGFVGYVREGFIPLQNAISMSFIYLIMNKTSADDIPRINLRRFPHRSYPQDALSIKLEFCLGSIILAGYIFPVAQLVKHFVIEKEDNIYNALTIIGVRKWLHYTAWFVYGVLALTFSIALVLFVLTLHFNDGYAILSKSSFIALLFFFVFYNMASTAYCLMFASFFTKRITAVLATCLFWFTTYLPFFTAIYDEEASSSLYAQYLFSNTILSHALDIILDFENFSDGFNWNDIFHTRTVDESATIGRYILIFIGLTVLYSIIALMADLLVLPQFLKQFFTRKPFKRERASTFTKHPHMRRTEIVEIEGSEKICTLHLKDLSKSYGGERVLKDVSMDLYEDCVTLLMGHNSSGKTSLLYLVAGLTKPTEGTITTVSPEEVNDVGFTFGIYLGEATFFRYLPVAKQLAFFSRIKGTAKENVAKEVEKYLVAMDLSDKRHLRTNDLSAGVRQQLAVCCALVGNSNVVILDQPTAHMDVLAKKRFWKLITREKKFRTVLMSSHLPDEVQIIADRLAILSGGKLKYCGSTALLRKTYGQNYRLVCIKGERCVAEEVTALICKYIPDAEPMSNICNELTYVFSPKFIDVLREMIDELEEHARELNVECIEISESSLHDIFYALAAENPSEGNMERHKEIMAGKSVYYREYESMQFMSKYANHTGFSLWLNQCYAILLKLMFLAKNMPFLLILQLCMPVVITISSYHLVQEYVAQENIKLKPLVFLLTQYKSSVTLIENNADQEILNDALIMYKENIYWMPEEHVLDNIPANQTFLDVMLAKLERKNERIFQKYFMAATFEENGITAWFNNYPLHTAPLALNNAHMALLRAYLDENARIRVTFHPLSFVHYSRNLLFESNTNVDNVLAINLVISFCLIWSIGIMFLVRDRTSRFKLIQLISGCSIFTYWSMFFLVDTVRIAICSLAVVITIWLLGSQHTDIFFLLFCVLVLGGLSIVSLCCFLSLCSDDQVDIYCFAIMFNLFGSIAFLSYLYILNTGFVHFVKGMTWAAWRFRIFVPFSLSNAFVKIFRQGNVRMLCEGKYIRMMSTAYENCQVFPNCCVKDVGDWSDHPMTDLVIVSVLTIVYWIMVFFVDYRMYHMASKCLMAGSLDEVALTEYEKLHRFSRHSGEGFDLANEVKKVIDLTHHEYYDKALICNGVTKYGMNADEANCETLYLVLEKGDCLTIPSVSGNGLNTLFKLFTGEVELSKGSIHVHGINFRSHRRKAYRHIGYCPGREPLLSDYTPAEVMQMICLLRGIHSPYIEDLCKSLSKVLGFYAHLDKELSVCSKGVCRRITCACALINTPALLFFDRPTSMIDPAGQRQLWYILEQLRIRNKATVLYSALKVQECERICTRTANFGHGRMLNIGTMADFARNKRQYFLLFVKIRKSAVEKPERVEALIAFILTKCRMASLKEVFGHVFIFKIPFAWNKVSNVFMLVQVNIFNLQIETFRVYPESFATTSVDVPQTSDA